MLTSKVSLSKTCKDGKQRNFICYYLNNIKVLTLKVPFETDWDNGCQIHTQFCDEFIENGCLYITKIKNGKKRLVKYPISKKFLDLT